jgi:xylulokinase
VPLHLHVIPNRLLLNASTPTGGAAIDWFRDLLLRDAGGDGYARYEALAGSAPPGSDGLVVLPHLAGSAVPDFDPAARGVVFGLAPHHGPGHLARASMEGVAFALAEMLDAERALGASPSEIHSVGGGSRSDLWLQIKADVANVPFVATAVQDAGALGAAILAGVGAGVFGSAEEGSAAMVRQRATFEPDAARAERYAEARAVYRELHPRLRPLFAGNRHPTGEADRK